MKTRTELGKKGELLVAEYLKKQGFTILTTNYSVRGGEIDIVAQKKEVLVFVEVKMRSNIYFNISEVITKNKQQKIILAARMYAARYYTTAERIHRFDVALVEAQNNDYAITYIPDAFTAQE